MHGPTYIKKYTTVYFRCVLQDLSHFMCPIGLSVHLLQKSNIFLWHCDQILGHGLPLRAFMITLIGHTTLSRTPLDAWSARRRNLPDNTQQSQETEIQTPAGFKPTIGASERPQTYALDGMATGIGKYLILHW